MVDKNEIHYQDEKADEAGQIKNLNAIMQLLLQQHQDFVSQIERLENKALGYLTPLSILLAATVAILIFLIQTEKKELFSFLCIFSFFGQVYFSIFTLFFALKAYSVKTSWYPDIKKHSQNWQIKEACFLGRINNAFIETVDELNKLSKKLVDYVQHCRKFLIFSMFFGILNIVFFIVYVLQHFIGG
jgi:hypothetical protein